MRFLNKIVSIDQFNIIDNELYCFSLDGNIEKFNQAGSMWKNYFNTQYFIAKFSNHLFCTWRDYSKILFFDPVSGRILKEKDISHFRILKVENESLIGLYFTTVENDRYKFSVGKLNKDLEFSILFDTKDAAPILFLDEFVLCTTDSNFLVCHPLSTGEEKWRTDIGELGKFEWEYTYSGQWQTGSITFMEEWNNILCVVLVNNVVLGIDIETGQIQWQRKMPACIITAPAFSEGKMYWFSLSHDTMSYHVVNMQTGEDALSIQPLKPPFEQGLIFTRPIVHNNWIVMTADNSRRVFIVDKNTGTVLDVIPLEGEGNRIPIDNSAKLQGNRLYQLDGDKTLHIFEYENLYN